MQFKYLSERKDKRTEHCSYRERGQAESRAEQPETVPLFRQRRRIRKLRCQSGRALPAPPSAGWWRGCSPPCCGGPHCGAPRCGDPPCGPQTGSATP